MHLLKFQNASDVEQQRDHDIVYNNGYCFKQDDLN